MKNKFLFLILLVSFSLGSCKKYLEVEPKNERPLTSVNDIKVVLAGYLKILKPGETTTYHNTLGDVMFFTPSYWSLFEFYSDNIDFERDYNSYMNAYSPSSQPEEAKLILINNFSIPTEIWVQHYKSIGFLNVLLDALDKTTDGDALVKQQLRNEMLVCRALYYYKLLQYFSPYGDNQSGIPIYTDIKGPFSGLSIPRSPQNKVFEFIIDQLEEAANSNAAPDPDYNIFYNKRYINNLLAQVYWYKAESGAKEASDYSNAKKFAEAALSGIVLPSNFSDYVNSLNGDFPNYPVYQRWGGYSNFEEDTYGLPWGTTAFTPHASPGLLAIFSPDDYRYQAFIKDDEMIVRPMNTWPRDYTTAYNLFMPNEAYLIDVEATLKDPSGGSEAAARTLLNNFRRMRGINSDFTGSDLKQEIINERRREFCFQQDMRWIDMKRYGLGTSRTSLELFGKSYNVTVDPNGYQFSLPIPVDEELKLNKAMTPNPGWNEILF